MKTETSEKLAELLEWLSTNPVHVLRLSADRGEVPAEDLYETLEALQDMGYWELMVLLVLKNDINPVVSQTLTRYTSTRIAEALRQDGILKFSKDFKHIFQDEMQKKRKCG